MDAAEQVEAYATLIECIDGRMGTSRAEVIAAMRSLVAEVRRLRGSEAAEDAKELARARADDGYRSGMETAGF